MVARRHAWRVVGVVIVGSDAVLQLVSQLLWNALLICAPVLALTLLVGLLISVLQVVTQVQDMSLTFIPKIVTAVVALTVFGPWMLRTLLKYATDLISNIPAYF
ncbi:MAG: flagellar biosynthesis protein FliQ [Burkholderiales bacterium]|nr:flagellar biosynthesis protein FliQ [Burkholderiales bacterium]